MGVPIVAFLARSIQQWCGRAARNPLVVLIFAPRWLRAQRWCAPLRYRSQSQERHEWHQPVVPKDGPTPHLREAAKSEKREIIQQQRQGPAQCEFPARVSRMGRRGRNMRTWVAPRCKTTVPRQAYRTHREGKPRASARVESDTNRKKTGSLAIWCLDP